MKKYKVLLLPAAITDLNEARSWYKVRNRQLPLRLKEQVVDTIKKLQTTPTAHAIRYKNVRIANVNIFPYAIHYIIEDENSLIVVLAIHHTAINPDKWSGRLI